MICVRTKIGGVLEVYSPIAVELRREGTVIPISLGPPQKCLTLVSNAMNIPILMLIFATKLSLKSKIKSNEIIRKQRHCCALTITLQCSIVHRTPLIKECAKSSAKSHLEILTYANIRCFVFVKT